MNELWQATIPSKTCHQGMGRCCFFWRGKANLKHWPIISRMLAKWHKAEIKLAKDCLGRHESMNMCRKCRKMQKVWEICEILGFVVKPNIAYIIYILIYLIYIYIFHHLFHLHLCSWFISQYCTINTIISPRHPLSDIHWWKQCHWPLSNRWGHHGNLTWMAASRKCDACIMQQNATYATHCSHVSNPS